MPYSKAQIQEVVRPWKGVLSDLFDTRHTTDLGRAYSAATNRKPNPDPRSDTDVTRVRSIIAFSNNRRPNAQMIWDFAKAARATGVKWFAGPLALLAAGYLTDFALVIEAAAIAGISAPRLRERLWAAPQACWWFGPQPGESREARTRRVDRCRSGDLVSDERRAWICKPNEDLAFEKAWLARASQEKDYTVIAASLVQEHLELGRGKQHEIAVTLLANWL